MVLLNLSDGVYEWRMHRGTAGPGKFLVSVASVDEVTRFFFFK